MAGWLRARQEGATTAFCPSPMCPAPSGGPKGSGRAMGEPSQGGTIRNGRGGGEREEPGVRTLLGAGGGRHTLGKRLGHIQSRPISKQSRGGVKGQLRPIGRKNTSEVRRKKRKKKKKSPTKQQLNPFGGLENGEWASFMSRSGVCPRP